MRNWVIRFLKVAGVLMVTLVLAEMCFRFYVIEFYSVELNALNSESELDDSEQTDVIFLGDSFTANANSYVAKLRGQIPLKMVNSAVSGTGVMEASFMAPSRLKKFKPKAVVYQIYLGNDLLDIRHRPHGEISWARKTYHAISDRVRVIKLMNYRLGQFRATVYNDLQPTDSKANDGFSVEKYSARQKMLFKQEPNLLENVFELKNGREEDYEVLVSRIHEIEHQLEDDCELIILLVPHCAQVNETYASRMKLIGLKSTFPFENEFYSRFEEEFSDRAVVNALPTFQSSDRYDSRLYLENDPHLSDYGQTVLAELLKPYLLEEDGEALD